MSNSSRPHTTVQPSWANEKMVQDESLSALAGLSPFHPAAAVTCTDPKLSMNSPEGNTVAVPTLSCTSQCHPAVAVQNNAGPLLQNQEVVSSTCCRFILAAACSPASFLARFDV